MIMKFASLFSAGMVFVIGESSTSNSPADPAKITVAIENTIISRPGTIQGAEAKSPSPTTIATWDPIQKGL